MQKTGKNNLTFIFPCLLNEKTYIMQNKKMIHSFKLESKTETSNPNRFSKEFIRIESPNGSEKTMKNKRSINLLRIKN